MKKSQNGKGPGKDEKNKPGKRKQARRNAQQRARRTIVGNQGPSGNKQNKKERNKKSRENLDVEELNTEMRVTKKKIEKEYGEDYILVSKNYMYKGLDELSTWYQEIDGYTIIEGLATAVFLRHFDDGMKLVSGGKPKQYCLPGYENISRNLWENLFKDAPDHLQEGRKEMLSMLDDAPPLYFFSMVEKPRRVRGKPRLNNDYKLSLMKCLKKSELGPDSTDELTTAHWYKAEHTFNPTPNTTTKAIEIRRAADPLFDYIVPLILYNSLKDGFYNQAPITPSLRKWVFPEKRGRPQSL